MGLGEADTRAKLIDPKLHKRRWTEDYIKRGKYSEAVTRGKIG
jgi:type I restriction enzyme, R subunit